MKKAIIFDLDNTIYEASSIDHETADYHFQSGLPILPDRDWKER